VEESDARVAPAALRFVVVYSSPLAQQPAQIYAAAQAKEAVALAEHVTRVQAPGPAGTTCEDGPAAD